VIRPCGCLNAENALAVGPDGDNVERAEQVTLNACLSDPRLGHGHGPAPGPQPL